MSSLWSALLGLDLLTGRLSGRELRLRVSRPEILVAAAGRMAGSTVSEPGGSAGIRANTYGPRRRTAVVHPAQA